MRADHKAAKPRTQAVYPYFGLGFRVNILNVPLILAEGEWIPDVDFNLVEERMAVAVPLKPAPLTGHEVRFLRRHLGLTLEQLAGQLGVTRQGVMKWEKEGDAVTRMSPTTETVLRLYALEAKGIGPAVFKKAFEALTSQAPRRHRIYRIDPRQRQTANGFAASLLTAA
jgi:transcriptional regulator with XRE-family HTH domain